MKRARRFVSAILASMMVMAMAITAAAASNVTITVPSDVEAKYADGYDWKENHVYEIYQLLKGDFEMLDGKKVITNATFGTGLKTEFQAGYENDAYKFLEAIKGMDGDAVLGLVKDALGTSITTAGKPGFSAALDKGYYLIKDTDGTLNEKHDGYTKYILLVVDEAKEPVVAKMDIPTVEKKVQENSDKEWYDVADYNLGDDVPFKLTTTIITGKDPKTGDYLYNTYKTYKLNFVDTMSKGLTLNKESIKVFVAGKEVAVDDNMIKVVGPTAVGTEGETQFRVEFKDTKVAPVNAKPGDEIRVEFTAKLNDDAKRMYDGNPNKVTLEYSNNPNDNGEGEPEGRTPEDKVIVFTYDLPAEKVDDNKENPTKLGGAKFKFRRELDGKYAQFGAPDAQGLRKVTAWVDEADATVLVTEEGKDFGFKGLDQGTYTLVEIEAPEGYNMPANPEFPVEIKATTDGGPIYNNNNKLEVEEITVNGEKDGMVSIENKQGIELPETGGIGTTIFYVIGAALMIGAGVVLVTRRRMAK